MGFSEGPLLADIVPGALYDPFVFAEASLQRWVLYDSPSDAVVIFEVQHSHEREQERRLSSCVYPSLWHAPLT